ncbi:uncharacterized protein LOC106670474 [Cimex lectularius]|uniref:Uncharacterized protein n=1 Tax=Cimex lectularius TaxID=79782 RepID=A0A8I6S3A7_CIMLE|nr:uncharacterized protein LOC106670474 [Cimex lectularius]XP_014256357.1 uncharacterized protein LOC106670474 [Cimex lectularius]XP_014256358.1 uncharacterized protein LOC106670474 [Cimex lectularius]
MRQFKEDEDEAKQKQEMMAYFTSVSSTLMDLAHNKFADGTWQIPLNQRDEDIEVSYQMPFVKKVSYAVEQNKPQKLNTKGNTNTGSKKVPGTASSHLPDTPRPTGPLPLKEAIPKKKDLQKMTPHTKIPPEKKALATQPRGTVPVKVAGDTDRRIRKGSEDPAAAGPSKARNRDEEYAAYQKDWGLANVEQSSKSTTKPTVEPTQPIEQNPPKAPSKSQENAPQAKKNLNKPK